MREVSKAYRRAESGGVSEYDRHGRRILCPHNVAHGVPEPVYADIIHALLTPKTGGERREVHRLLSSVIRDLGDDERREWYNAMKRSRNARRRRMVRLSG